MNKNDAKTKHKHKRWSSFFWGSWKYEPNRSHAKLTWHPLGVTYFACDPLRSYFHEPQKNEIHFLNVPSHVQGLEMITFIIYKIYKRDNIVKDKVHALIFDQIGVFTWKG